jgi:type II secretory pathway pseudopilin PulG
MERFPASLAGPRGFTVVELTALLCILTLLLAAAAPRIRFQLDRLAVTAARDEVMGLFHQARGEAVARGGSTLRATTEPPTLALVSDGETLASTDLRTQFGVSLDLPRGRPEVALRFDPLGLGRVASQTLRLSRGEAEALLVVSSFGRVRRE